MFNNALKDVGDDWEEISDYYPNYEVQISGDTVTFPTDSYELAGITGARILKSETKFLGMGRKTAVPAIAGAFMLVLALLQFIPAFLIGGIVIAARLVFSMLGIAVLQWTKDKRQMFNYTVVLDTARGPMNAFTSTNKETVRRMVSAINRVVRDRDKQEAEEHEQVEKQPEAVNRKHNTGKPHKAFRPEALPKLRERR